MTDEKQLLLPTDGATQAMAAAHASDQQQGHNLVSLTGDFFKAAAYSAVERPLNGLAQFSNHAFGTNIGQIHALDLNPASSGAQTIAEQAGMALGTMAPFMLARGGVRFVGRNVIGLSESTSLLGVASENAATGFTMGFLMTPEQSGSKDNFWLSRVKSGTVDAATFATLSAGQKYLSDRFPLPSAEATAAEALPLRARILRSSLIGAASGLPAGFVNAEAQSITDGKGLAHTDAIAGDMGGFALFGALMGPLDAFMPTGERGRPGKDGSLEDVFAQRSRFQEAMGRAAVRHDLSMHRAYDVEANQLGTGSVLDKLNDAGFNRAQRNRILSSLAYVREGFSQQRGADGMIEADQKGNWLHTMDEFDAALDISRGMPPEFRQKLVMAMFGDSWKTKFNFTRHNYDGAEVGRIVLSRQTGPDFTAEDVHGIVEANKEHQISPSGLMSMLYNGKIVGTLNAERTLELTDLVKRVRTPEQISQLSGEEKATAQADRDRVDELHSRLRSQLDRMELIKKLKDQQAEGRLDEQGQQQLAGLSQRARFGNYINDQEASTLMSLQTKMADPYAQPLEQTPQGGMAVKLTPAEQEMLRVSGIDYWHVPHESTPWFAESRMGVMADILANLGLGGRRKLTGLNGPETEPMFEFPRIRQCVDSGLKTYADINKILSPDEYGYVQARLGTMDSAVQNALDRVGGWLRGMPEFKNNQSLENVPFWSSDLVYPQRGDDELVWREINRVPRLQRTPEQQDFWNEHRLDGLSDQQKQDYLRAIEIRNRTVEELGRELRRDNQFVPDFRPVMNRTGLLGAADTVRALRADNQATPSQAVPSAGR